MAERNPDTGVTDGRRMRLYEDVNERSESRL